MSTHLTKFSHSCVRFDDGDRSLVIDPGTLSETDVALDGAGGVLITHEHPDHFDVDAVRSAAAADPRMVARSRTVEWTGWPAGSARDSARTSRRRRRRS
jgi:L-ascorbate metabolism protein UlaG (beta-lactamase superfamily)